MQSKALATFVAVSLAICILPDQAWAQQMNTQDPIAIEEQLLRWQMEEMARQRADAERERVANHRQEAYQRQMCLRAGFRGQDVDQCVRDSEPSRRTRSGYSEYTMPERARSYPSTECITFGDGVGGGITECY
jgi:hypothetical protein